MQAIILCLFMLISFCDLRANDLLVIRSNSEYQIINLKNEVLYSFDKIAENEFFLVAHSIGDSFRIQTSNISINNFLDHISTEKTLIIKHYLGEKGKEDHLIKEERINIQGQKIYEEMIYNDSAKTRNRQEISYSNLLERFMNYPLSFQTRRIENRYVWAKKRKLYLIENDEVKFCFENMECGDEESKILCGYYHPTIDKNGKKILCEFHNGKFKSPHSPIVEIDLETKKIKDFLSDGRNPQYSLSSNLVLYKSFKGSYVIYDISNKQFSSLPECSGAWWVLDGMV